MNWTWSLRQRQLGGFLIGCLLVLLLAGCEPAPLPEAATSTPAPPTATPIPSPTPRAAAQSGGQPSAGQTAVQAAPVQDTSPLAGDEALPPVRLAIPAIGLDVAVAPMSWRIADVQGKRTTVWVLPDSAAGWHPNSAGAGAAGNLVISGHQLLGDAPFAQIALGEMAVGQEILVTDGDERVFVYRVTEVGEPVAISDDLAAEEAFAAALTSQQGEPRLTLISGWPDFSSTHRIYVVAAFVGAQP